MTATLAEPAGRAAAVARAIPWVIYAVLFAATSVEVGVVWDISWHRTIGRDTFWTPAHLAIYLGGMVAGFACGWLVLRTTFAGTPEKRAAGVAFWGFRGPLGAWVSIWGSFAMITSAPFDNWWHNAYGLDVEILSPPHAVLALGIDAIKIGALLMVLAEQNRTALPARRRALSWMFAYVAGLLISGMAIMATEYVALPNRMHNGLFYQVSAGIFPLLLVAVARASKLPYPASAAAAGYMAFFLALNWLLPLFPAQALLAPIYNPVTHMVPYPFPLLLVLPALALDLLMTRRRWGSDWLQAAALAGAFLAVLLAVQWEFAEFMLTPDARNWFFTADRWDYSSRLGPWRYEFWDMEDHPLTPSGLAIALAIAFAASRIGLWWGGWMARVRR